jgi:hypothetical protein
MEMRDFAVKCVKVKNLVQFNYIFLVCWAKYEFPIFYI